MFKCKSLLFAALATVSFLPLTQFCSAQSPAPTVSPITAAKLRGLLPFPEATLDPKMEVSTFGLGHSPEQGYYFYRQSSDYAGQIVAIRRQMTGGVADAARYRQLGGLYRQAGLSMRSNAAFQQSEALYDAVLAQCPDDGPALAGYGQTLKASGQIHAAEAYLRKAAQSAPNSADVWMALGDVLASEFVPYTEPKKHWEREAGAAYDKAVSLAPQNPAVWTERGDFRTWSYGRMFSRDGLSDYVRAASLLPHDPDAQAQVPTIECFSFELAHRMFTSPKAAKMEPAVSDHRAEGYLRRITVIAQATHRAQAAEAYTARAWVQFEFFYDPKGAQKSLHLALQQNPRQQDAIDYQMHVAGVTGDYALLATACRRELRRRPQSYLRVLLADADFNIAQQKPRYWQEGLTQMELAHAAVPHDDACRLGLATLLLKFGQAADQSRAAVLLSEIAFAGPGRSKGQQADYDLTRGVSAALAGHQDKARALLTQTLQDDPHNHAARAALMLL